MTAPNIHDFACLAMAATVRSFASMKNVPLGPDRLAQVAESATAMLSVTDVYGLAKAHRASVLAAGAAVNRCLDIIAATRAAIAKAQREEPHPDLDAIAARVREAPDLYIPAEAREDIYRWPSLADSTSTPLVLLATPDQEAP